MRYLKWRLLQVVVIVCMAVLFGCGNGNSGGMLSQNRVLAIKDYPAQENKNSGVAGASGATLGNAGGGETSGSDLTVDFIDIGQGDAELLRSQGHAMLIDTGTPDSGTAVRLFLKKQGVGKLDYLVLTHPDADHIGGAASVITNVPVDTVWMPDYKKENKVYDGVINALKYKSIQAVCPSAGQEVSLGSCLVKVLGPINRYEDPNNNSIVLQVTCGNNKFMFVGDAQEEELADVTARFGKSLDSDVYKVGHHGSHNSSSKEFLDVVSPKYSVISCAEGNSYGHPHAETMIRLMKEGSHIFRTDKQGTITIRSDGRNISYDMAPCDDFTPGEMKMKPRDVAGAGTGAQDETLTATQESETVSYKYVKNTSSHKFHLSGCDSVKDMKEKNKECSNQSREEIIAEGYKPCQRCTP